MLNIIDEGTREYLAIEKDTSLLSAQRVVQVLEQLKAEPELSCQIWLDNGPELISAAMTNWCKENHVELVFIHPRKPPKKAL